MSSLRLIRPASAAVFLLSLIASSAEASVVLPGQTGVGSNELKPSVGAVVVATQTQPFATANYTGTLESTVLSNDTTNALGGYTFTYKLSNDFGSANALTRLNVNGFAGYATDISYRFGSGGLSPTLQDRDATGNVVGWHFLGQPIGLGVLNAGITGDTLVVQTNALGYQTRIANVSNGAVSPVNAYSAAGAISPEPSSLLAMAAGALLLRRRR